MNAARYQDMCGAPMIKPIDANGRGEYETGKASFNTHEQPAFAFETQANILQQPGWLTSLFGVIPQLADTLLPAWILLFDLTPALVNQLFTIATGIVPDDSIARYSLGPIRPSDHAATGGSIVYEATAEEVPCRPATGQQFQASCGPDGKPRLPPDVKGMPFNFGIIAVVSSTPRILTTKDGQGTPLGLLMAITARMQA